VVRTTGSKEEETSNMSNLITIGSAGPKPMQPTQLQWAPRLWGPRAMVFG